MRMKDKNITAEILRELYNQERAEATNRRIEKIKDKAKQTQDYKKFLAESELKKKKGQKQNKQPPSGEKELEGIETKRLENESLASQKIELYTSMRFSG